MMGQSLFGALALIVKLAKARSVFKYERDPGEIYRQSFDVIRREADLSAFSRSDRALAERMIHACGQVDLVKDLVIAAGARRAGTQAFFRNFRSF